LKNALDYLIGEKLFAFVTASEQYPHFAADLPAFGTAIRRLFAPGEIREYLDHLEQAKFLGSVGARNSDADEKKEEPWPTNPVRGAEEMLRFSRIRQLL
jgi:hypothetical protein